MPAAAGTQDVQDAIEQAAGVAARSADVRLCWGEGFQDNIPQIVVDFPEGHIFLGQPHLLVRPRRVQGDLPKVPSH